MATPQSLDIGSVEKFNWKTGASRDRWWPSLRKTQSAMNDVQLRAVVDDDHPRRFARLHVDLDPDPQLLKQIADMGLVFDYGPRSSRAFSNGEPEEKDARLLWVAESEAVIDEYRAARNAGDGERTIREHGDLFGIPDCCVDAFVEWMGDEDLTDPIFEAAKNSSSAVEVETRDYDLKDPEHVRIEDPDPLLNPFFRHVGFRLVFHFPCSFECEASHDLGVEYGRLYRELGLGDEAEDLYEFLAAPAWWSGYNGLAHVKNGYAIGSYVTDDRWDERVVTWKRQHQPKRL